jgi:hypothetical protein
VTTGTLNWPVRKLTDRERTIREAVDRVNTLGATPADGDFGDVAISGSGTVYRVESAANVLFVTSSAEIQPALDSLTNGGVVWVAPGTFTGDLTITKPNVTLRGGGLNSTYFTGSITVEVGQVKLQDFTCRATGKAAGIKLFKSGAGIARCELRNVYVGASASGAGDGPTKGLYLDGAILTVVDHCTFAYNTGAGVYVNTTSATYSTNVNTFRDCTMNGNGTYGFHAETGGDGVTGMMLHRIMGGNMESNVTGDVYIDGGTFASIQGVDFECAVDHSPGQIVYMNAVQPVVIEDCNFVLVDHGGVGTTVSRFFLLDSCANAIVRRNRLSASGSSTWSQGAVGVFGEGCVQCTAYDNLLWNAGAGRFINNRGSFRGNVG